jgi:uncharacterized protein
MGSKKANLEQRIARMGSALVAFSGGVDSSLLVHVAHSVLGERVLAVTSRSATHPAHEVEAASRIAESIGAEHMLLDTREMDDPDFMSNPPERCYTCKREMFSMMKDVASARGLENIIEGSNADDVSDHRPGRRAISELGIISPYLDVGMHKQEIRDLARKAGLPNADKPAMACLATRIPYGEPITEERLARVGRAERSLIDMGYTALRIRDHGTVARIEVRPADIPRVLDERDRIVDAVRAAGFSYVSLDLQGYRTGAMNEVLDT